MLKRALMIWKYCHHENFVKTSGQKLNFDFGTSVNFMIIWLVENVVASSSLVSLDVWTDAKWLTIAGKRFVFEIINYFFSSIRQMSWHFLDDKTEKALISSFRNSWLLAFTKLDCNAGNLMRASWSRGFWGENLLTQ